VLKRIKRYIKSRRHPYYTADNRRYAGFEIGAYTYGKPKIYGAPGSVSIGKFCSIADGVTLYCGGEHRIDWVSAYNFGEKMGCGSCTRSNGKVTIGNDVWIGDGALLLSGVTVADGAVIGARAVVTKDVAPYEIVAGNPARHIRYRFSEGQIAALQAICWWEWPIEKIRENFDLILSDDIDAFIAKHDKGA
jgi:acetyltransferase-like isoleucine patch superfamily enzyme